MEIEDSEVNKIQDKDGGETKPPFKGDSGSSMSSSPPPSPSKVSPQQSYKGKMNSDPHSPGGEVNGERGDNLDQSEATSPPNKSPLAGITAPKIPNIKIKKQYSKIYRIKTKILQNLGKADKTHDELFDDYEINFNKQQLNANRLHKEISNYLRCARALHGASKALFETLSEVYEPGWVGHDLLYVQAQNSDMLWTDFCHKIQDQSLGPLTAYTLEFPEIRKKIDKRGRKLVDYDSQRHQLENLQRSTRRDEYKIARVKDQLESARSTYETLNKELYSELPNIFDERIPSVATSLQTLFSAEATFMEESSKISNELDAIAQKLSKECSKGTYNTQRGTPPKAPRPISVSPPSPSSPNAPAVWYDTMDREEQAAQQSPTEGKGSSPRKEDIKGNGFAEEMIERESPNSAKSEELFVPPKDEPENISSFRAESSPNKASLISKEEDSAPSKEDSAPIKEDSAPNKEDSAPNKEDSAPNKEDSTPNKEDSAPNKEDSASIREDFTHIREDSTPESEDSTPDREDSTPNRDDSAKNIGNSAPKKEEISSNSDVPVPIQDQSATLRSPTPPTLPLTPPPGSPQLPAASIPPTHQRRRSKDENRATISNPISAKEEGGRPYEEIEFEDKKVNGTPKINGEVIGTQIPPGHKTKLEEIYDIPVGATTDGLPPGVLYRVRATYRYVREDVDELGFDVGETIQVVEYDDPEEQEEGWLCGIKETTNEKGLFPANFTRPI